MRNFRSKIFVLMLVVMIVSTAFFGCRRAPRAGDESSLDLTFATVSGALYYYIVYVAKEKGWFADAGVNMRDINFTNGPVMVEALASDGWDFGISGIGGQLPAVITYDAVLITPINSDDGAQRLFVRNNSPILAAGTGHNILDSRIYGTAATWRGQRVICNPGAVLHYFLIRVLEGFDLSTDDIHFLSMDVATAGSAFRAGEGDVVAMTGSGGTMAMLADPNFTSVAEGPWLDTGLMGAAYANRNIMSNPDKIEAITRFMVVYYKTLDWVYNPANYREVIDMMMDFTDEMGIAMDRPSAEFYLNIDRFYGHREALEMMTTTAAGKNYSVMEDKIIGVLNFFIDSGSRQRGEAERFPGNVNTSVMQEVVRRLEARS